MNLKLEAPVQSETKSSMPVHIGASMKVGMGSFGSWMLGVGSIIGSMAWLFHGPMLARSGPAACMTAWIIAGVLVLPLTLILMELSSMFPSAGGPYVYKYYALKRLIPKMGELFGFLTGWIFWVAMIVCMACMSNGLTNLLSSTFWGESAASPIWFGPAIIFTLFGSTTVLNLLSVGKASKANIVFAVMKFIMAFSFAALVFTSGHWSLKNALQFASPATGSTNFFGNVSSVLMLALVGFGGIEASGCISSETANATKSVPKAMFLTLMSVAAIYLSMCFCISIASPYDLSSDKSTLIVAGTAVQATCPALAGMIGGPIWGSAFTACVIASIIGCSFAVLLMLSRITYSMAETGLFPKQFAHLDERTKVPIHALWFQFACVTVIGIGANLLARFGLFPDAYAFLADAAGFMYAFIVMLYGVSVVSLRYTDPDLPRPYRIGKRGNVLAWIMALITIGIWGYAAFGCVQWAQQLTGLIILLAGIPIYYYYQGIKNKA